MQFLLLLIVIVAAAYYFLFGKGMRRSDGSPQNDGSPASSGTVEQPQLSVDEMLQKVLGELNCEYHVEKSANGLEVYDFTFQAGSFRVFLNTANRVANLEFPRFIEESVDLLPLVRDLCAKCNRAAMSHFYLYHTSEERATVLVDVVAGIVLDGDYAAFKKYFLIYLKQCFLCRNTFEHLLQEGKETLGTKHLPDIEQERYNVAREAFLLSEQERSHNANRKLKTVLKPAEVLSLGYFLDCFYDNLFVDPLELIVASKEERQIFSRAEEIRAFNLLSPVVAGAGPSARFISEQAVLLLTFMAGDASDTHTLTITLQPSATTEEALYVRLTFCRSRLTSQPSHPRGWKKEAAADSIIVAYDRADAEQKRAEFNYMIGEVHGSLFMDSPEKAAALSDEEKFLEKAEFVDADYNIYWGRRYFQQKRYYEALAYFCNVRDVLYEGHKRFGLYEEKFGELSYLIGFCYNELGLYERAYYYLDGLLRYNNIRYTTAYVNCLVNAGDFRAMNVVDTLLEQLQEPEDDEGNSPAYTHFFNFLRRRKVYLLTERMEYQEAERICRRMLNEPENADFALSELAAIKRVRDKDVAANADVAPDVFKLTDADEGADVPEAPEHPDATTSSETDDTARTPREP